MYRFIAQTIQIHEKYHCLCGSEHDFEFEVFCWV